MASTTGPGPLDAAFTAAIRKDGAYPTHLELPGSDALLGTRRAVGVTGTLDGHPFRATLMPSDGARTGSRCARRCAGPSAGPAPGSRSGST